MEGEEVAIFWDYENIRAAAKEINVPIVDALIAYAETIGYPTIKKVYSNWKNISETINRALYSMGFETIQVSMGKENSVDVKLTVDCMDTAFKNPTLSHFIIVTGDKDYISLVNWLRNHKKNVIIIGKTETVSDHLMLSANAFVSLEELPETSPRDIDSELEQDTLELIKFEQAVECLVESISLAREQGKSTRFEVIDAIMRTMEKCNYHGATSVLKNRSNTFKSFSSFIATAEEKGIIKVQVVEGFKELFLPEDDPELESDFSTTLVDSIDKEHWGIIIEQIEEAFEKDTEDSRITRYGFISKTVGNAKKEGRLPLSNQIIYSALNTLISLEYLLLQEDGGFQINEIYKNNFDLLFEKISKKS